MKRSEFEKILREVISSEVRKQFRVNLPIVMKEVLLSVLEENAGVLDSKPTLNESVTEEWPTLGKKAFTAADRSRLSNMVSSTPDAIGGSEFNILPEVVSDGGQVIPIPASKLPPSLVSAMNKDYSSFLKKMDGVKIPRSSQ